LMAEFSSLKLIVNESCDRDEIPSNKNPNSRSKVRTTSINCPSCPKSFQKILQIHIWRLLSHGNLSCMNNTILRAVLMPDSALLLRQGLFTTQLKGEEQ
jgi:hypothetical protein